MTYSDTYVGKLVLTLRAAEDERDAALARCERLQEALRPFAARLTDDGGARVCGRTDDVSYIVRGAIAEECRRAREALEQP
jgi:hypothetical protein